MYLPSAAIAYVSREYAEPELFIQQLRSGMRLNWVRVKDVAGHLEFKEGVVTYKSKSDNITVRLEDVSKRLKEKFGAYSASKPFVSLTRPHNRYALARRFMRGVRP